MATGLHYIHRIRHRNNFEVSPQWKQRLSELAKKTAISRNILFLESEMISVPAVIGFLKPVLLVPAGLLTNLPVEQVEAILLHELAHIHRADFLINLMQSVIEAFFFFNPGVVWISSLIAQEREACCDDLVIASIPQKTSYLQALTSFQELHLYPKPAAMALTRNKYYLLDRVKRMLTLENKNLNFMEKTVLLLSILGITAFSFIAAQRKEDAAQVAVVKKQTFELPKNPWPTTVPLHETKKPANNQKKAALLTSSKLHVDTIPKPNTGQGGERSFPSISSNTSNDGDHVVSQVDATDNEGKHYSIKRVDGQITGLSVDGKAIAQNQYGQYDDVIRQIDESQQQRFLKRKQELELKKADFMVKQKQMQEKREQLAMASAKQRSQQIELKKQMQIQLKMKENRRFLEEKKTEMLQRRKFDQKKAEFIKKEKLFGPETRSNNDISRIISDLRDQNLVSDENNLSFTLTSNELIVNGKRQPSDIHQHFKDRYIQNSADRFTYSKKGNTTSITINKE